MQASFLPFIMVKQGSYIKKLINKKAIDPDTAISPQEAEIPDNLFIKKLLKQNLLVRTADGKLYANIDLLSKNKIWKRYIDKKLNLQQC